MVDSNRSNEIGNKPDAATRHQWQKSLPGAFVDAGHGLSRTLRTERNLRIHFGMACIMMLWCLAIRPNIEWMTAVVGAVAVVMAVELVNTAIEHAVDLTAGTAYHELAKRAKEAAAGAVLVSSIGAMCLGISLGVDLWPWHFLLFTGKNLFGACESGLVFALLLVWGTFARAAIRI